MDVWSTVRYAKCHTSQGMPASLMWYGWCYGRLVATRRGESILVATLHRTLGGLQFLGLWHMASPIVALSE